MKNYWNIIKKQGIDYLEEKMELPAYVTRALLLLKENNIEAWLVGGCVRDYLMGVNPTDYDIAVSSEPEDTKCVFSEFRIIETGLKHGTISVLMDGNRLEITTFRIESGYSDMRHPDKVCFSKNIEEDLSRRDFTMNAIAYSVDGVIKDPFGGVKDIQNQIINCVGDAENRFNEDALRIMRAIRFSSVLEFEITSETEKAIHNQKELLDKISNERIRDELVKILGGKNVYSVLLKYKDVICCIIPQYKQLSDETYEYVCKIANNTRKEDLEIQLAAILKVFKSDIAREVLSKLKFSNQIKHDVCHMIDVCDNLPDNNIDSVRMNMVVVSDKLWDKVSFLRRLFAGFFEYGEDIDSNYFDSVDDFANMIIQNGDCISKSMLNVNGNDLIEMGLLSEQIGTALDMLFNDVVSGKIKNEKQSLTDAIKKYAMEGRI